MKADLGGYLREERRKGLVGSRIGLVLEEEREPEGGEV